MVPGWDFPGKGVLHEKMGARLCEERANHRASAEWLAASSPNQASNSADPNK